MSEWTKITLSDSETIVVIHMSLEEKKKLYNYTIAKISLQCKFQFSVSLYNYNF